LIIFLVTREHPYTVEQVVQKSPGLELRILTYDELFDRRVWPRATYVFTDTDRLPVWRVSDAAKVYRHLRDSGFRVLNDPASMPSRYGLLRSLYRCGINKFNAYRVEEKVVPVRWPVFLRTEADHRIPPSHLMYDWNQVRRGITTAISVGIPITSLLLVEYAAEPVSPGLFRKLSIFRIGDAYVSTTCVHEDNWIAKNGTVGIATPELYKDELRIVRENPFERPLRPVFELANIEYGRVDFGLVGGKPQIYEINSNPHVKFEVQHPSEFRIESYQVFKQNFYEALTTIDM
jgi:hypothetical protein